MDDKNLLDHRVHELLSRTVRDLKAGGIRDEAMANLKPARRRFGLTTRAVMVPVGRAWRLGVLLLDREGHLYATGGVTRAIEPKRGVANRSHDAELRRADQRAAVRGNFAEGEVVNFRFAPVALDGDSLRAASGPLFVNGDNLMVRLDAGIGGRGASRLDDYLADRVRLMTLD